MVDLLVPTSSDQLFILKILVTFVAKQAILMRRPIVLSLSLQLVFPVVTFSYFHPSLIIIGKSRIVEISQGVRLG